MASFAERLDPSCCVVGLEADSREDVIRSLVGLLDRAGACADAGQLARDVLEREKLMPTGLGEGCAVPHAQSAGASRTAVAAAVLARPVDFGAPDDRGARLVFLIAGPPDSAAAHLKLLARLARLLHDPDFREVALASRDGAALRSLVVRDED